MIGVTSGTIETGADKKTAAALTALAETLGGRLSPAAVLDAARDPQSLLHDQFEWNDGAAAEAFRLIQAGALIRRIKIDVVIEQKDPVRVQVRAFVSQPSMRGTEVGSYVPYALADPNELRRDAVTQLDNVRRRFQHISELGSVWREIERANEAETVPHPIAS